LKRDPPHPASKVKQLVDALSQIPFGRLLCAIDFSEASLTALQCALSLAEESDAAESA
jgi:hypothetical protein